MADRSKKKKIKLQKKTGPIHEVRKKTGLTMPVGMVSDNSVLSFRDMADLRGKYFTFHGRLARKPFTMRMLLLSFAQFFMTVILLNRLIEAVSIGEMGFAILFAIIFFIFTIPIVVSQFSLGSRRIHDLNQPGFLFVLPYICYVASFLLTAWNYADFAMIAQALTAILYIGLFTIRGTVGDNAYDRERSR